MLKFKKGKYLNGTKKTPRSDMNGTPVLIIYEQARINNKRLTPLHGSTPALIFLSKIF